MNTKLVLTLNIGSRMFELDSTYRVISNVEFLVKLEGGKKSAPKIVHRVRPVVVRAKVSSLTIVIIGTKVPGKRKNTLW